MKKNQSGFSAIEAIIIIVVVAVLGFGAWYVWNTSKDNKKSQNSSETQNNETVDGTKLTTKLTSHNEIFSLQLPDGWKVTNDTTNDFANAIGLGNVTYTAGTPAVVTEASLPGGDGPTSTSFTISGGDASDYANLYNGTDYESFKTTGGLEGKKFTSVSKEDDETATPGTKFYTYKFTKGDKAVLIYYIESPGVQDQLKIVEDALKTLQLQ